MWVLKEDPGSRSFPAERTHTPPKHTHENTLCTHSTSGCYTRHRILLCSVPTGCTHPPTRAIRIRDLACISRLLQNAQDPPLLCPNKMHPPTRAMRIRDLACISRLLQNAQDPPLLCSSKAHPHVTHTHPHVIHTRANTHTCTLPYIYFFRLLHKTPAPPLLYLSWAVGFLRVQLVQPVQKGRWLRRKYACCTLYTT